MQKILIIEDDTNINNMIAEYLGENGYECVQAFSGSEGALRFSMEKFALIILDLMLPGITGEELIKQFAGKVPVIVLSAKIELDSKVISCPQVPVTIYASPLICRNFWSESRCSCVISALRGRVRKSYTGIGGSILRRWK